MSEISNDSEEGWAAVGDSPAERFEGVLELVLRELGERIGLDWSLPAASLEWSCRHTIDHMVDGVFSCSFQLASRARKGFLPFNELHATSEASASELVTGLAAVGELLTALLRSVPSDAEASDGVLMLNADDWAARAAYELLVHTHDIARGLGSRFDPPFSVCSWVMSSSKLWILDRESAAEASNPWEALLIGSGRATHS
jgi:hypothetical protein